jgi:hypothetical protein
MISMVLDRKYAEISNVEIQGCFFCFVVILLVILALNVCVCVV